MAWRTYKIPKKLHRAFNDGFHTNGRVWITIPKNDVFPAGYGFAVTPKFSDKNLLYLPDSYEVDICIDPAIRESGKRYTHFKMKVAELREKLFYRYEVVEKAAKPTKIETIYGGTVYGYARISRPQQSIDRQIRNIKAIYPSAVIVQEAYTGTKMDRPVWGKLSKKVRSGDTIVFDSVSRMSRNADEGVETYFNLYQKGIQLVFLKERYIDTAIYEENMADKIKLQGTDEDEIFKGLNKYFHKLAERQIRIAFEQAEKEVQDLHQRTKEGIETARLNGKQIGQRPGNKLKVKKEAPAKELIRKHSKDFGGSLADQECMRLAGVSRNTYYKYKRELKEK